MFGYGKGKLAKLFGKDKIDKIFKKEYGLSEEATSSIIAVTEKFDNKNNNETRTTTNPPSAKELKTKFATQANIATYTTAMSSKENYQHLNITVFAE
jgi:hypothetical protein